MKPVVNSYRFDTLDGTKAVFDLTLDGETLQLPDPEGELPAMISLFRPYLDYLADSSS